MKDENRLSENESLLIIQQMIETAKQEQKSDGIKGIFWGWLLLLVSLVSFANSKMQWFSQYFFWNVFGGLTLSFFLFMIIRNFFFNRMPRVKTYTGDLLERLNIGFFVSLLFLIIAMNVSVTPITGFTLLINLYGFWILIYGAVLNFRPSIIGAFITWGIGLVALFAHTFETVMLLNATAVLCGYVIPGHIANIQFRKGKLGSPKNKEHRV
jgi:hypothetical protein